MFSLEYGVANSRTIDFTVINFMNKKTLKENTRETETATIGIVMEWLLTISSQGSVSIMKQVV